MNIIREICQALRRPDYPSKWVWQSVSWDEIKRDIIRKILDGGAVKSTPTKNYTGVIEVGLLTKFYWTEEGFDGISFGYPLRELFEWEQEMLDKCMSAMK